MHVPPNQYKDNEAHVCVACPPAKVKQGYGTDVIACIDPPIEPISTAQIVAFGIIAFTGLIFATVFYRWQKSDDIYEASSVAMSSVSVAIGSLLSELVDFISDAIACYNVYTSIDIAEEKTTYIAMTIMAAVAFILGFTERIANLRWQFETSLQ